MKIRRNHLIIAGLALLGLTFLTIGVLHQKEPINYYAHSLRTWQEADSVAGYPIQLPQSEEDEPKQFITTQFQPNLSSMSPMERFRLPTAQGFQRFPEQEARAAGTGLVLYAGNPAGYDGFAVLLGHRLPDGSIIQSFYSGLSKLNVKVGQHIPRGSYLGEGSCSLEIRKGVSIDIAQEELAGHLLNSKNSPPPANRLKLAPFFKEHGLASPSPDPLTIIQKNEKQAARQKLGLE